MAPRGPGPVSSAVAPKLLESQPSRSVANVPKDSEETVGPPHPRTTTRSVVERCKEAP